jgi:hypothetical protein
MMARYWLLSVHRWQWTFFQSLSIPDHAFPGIAGEFEILGQLERIGGAGIFAEPAEHAPAKIVGKGREFLASRFLVAFAGDHDQVFRARQRAQVARDAEAFAGIRIDVQARRSAISLGHLWPFQRILLGVDLFGILISESYP